MASPTLITALLARYQIACAKHPVIGPLTRMQQAERKAAADLQRRLSEMQK